MNAAVSKEKFAFGSRSAGIQHFDGVSWSSMALIYGV